MYAPIYVRHSSLRLPYHSTKPVVMVGPGTGLAPFRGFIQERASIKQAGQSVHTHVGHQPPLHGVYIIDKEYNTLVT